MGTPLFSRASGFGALFAIFEAEQGTDALLHLRNESKFKLTTYSPSTLIPFTLMNRVYNLAAKLSGDRQFGARVGQNIHLEEFGPFVEYALHGENLEDVIARSVAGQRLHSSDSSMDLRILAREARWRIRYATSSEATVEHHAQRSLMQMFHAVCRYAGPRKEQIDIYVAEPYAAEARLLEGRLGVRVRPRASDYELAFPAEWLAIRRAPAGLPSNIPVEALATYHDRPLPRAIAEAVLAALALHEDLLGVGISVTAAEIGLPSRTLQYALRREGVSYREILRGLRILRARQLLATTEKPLAEVALRAGYSDPSNFHRAFLSLTGMTPGWFREVARPIDATRA